MNLQNPSQKNRSFFVQLILSNLLVVLVCVVSMTLILLFTVGVKNQTQQRNTFHTTAQTKAGEVSQTLDSIKDIANNLLFVQQVQPFTYHQRPMRAIELIASLNTMKASNPYLSDVFVYFFQDEYVYSSRNSQHIDDFSATIGQDLSPQGSLRGEISAYMRPVYRMQEDALLIFYPYMSNYENQGMLVFSVPAPILVQLLPAQSKPFQATALYSAHGLLGSAQLTGALQEQMRTAASVNDVSLAGESFVRFEGGYNIFGTALSANLYFLYMSHDASLLGFLLNPKGYILLLAVCLCSVILAAWYFARKSYTPVRVLHETLHSPGALTQAEPFQEFQDFVSGYSGLQEKNRKLHQALQEKCALQQAQLLGALLRGNTDYYEDFYAQAQDLGMELDAPYHLLLSVQGDQGLFLNALHPLLEYHRRYTHSLPGLAEESLYIIGCGDKPDAETLEYINSMDCILVSVPVSEIEQLHTCYMRLRAGQLSHTEASQSTAALLAHYTQENQRIAHLLEVGELCALRETALQLAQALPSGQLSLTSVRYLCYEIFYQYRNYQENHALPQRGRLLSPETLLQDTAGDVTGLAHALVTETDRLIAQITAQSQTATRTPMNIEAILQCVQEHFMEASFSLQMIAETFHVSSSYLSTYFKDNYGMKMLDYCTLLRMERAKELLHTDLTLLAISQQIGYYNISSFMRRFKQITGVTPGEYKKSLSTPTAAQL